MSSTSLQIGRMLCIGIVSISLTCLSQNQNTGSITGIIFDPQRAVIIGARVLVRNQETRVTAWAITDGSGAYSISHLPTGYYSVEVAAAGFGVTRSSHIRVAAGESVLLNETLALAAAHSEIRVSEVAAIVQNETSR